METPFVKLRARIDELRDFFENTYDVLEIVSAPGFDPMDMPDGTDFPRGSATPNQLSERLQEESPELEMDYQLSMVALCLQQMKITNTLIDMQNAYKAQIPHEEWGAILEAINGDSERFTKLMKNASELRDKRTAHSEHTYNLLDEDSYREDYNQLVRENEKVEQGQMSWAFRFATKPPKLLEMIFEQRLASLELSLSSLEMLSDRIKQNMEDYAMIVIARDECILPNSPFLHELQTKKQNFCEFLLPRAEAALNVVDHFWAELQKMGVYDGKSEEFKVNAYTPLSIKGLPQFTP